ncbi:hydrolase [Pseudomonas fluorescens]|uniref:Hydrolase n=1 Tax=Pseudomonas fluorescens TaxID=294 RepID=A0A5E7UZY8_PSEFL|nr:hydrolase [Pseudomonas fluorescens]VVQ16125.1 hypothetical protein PS941_04348 [Pseudomonas fluorescens]
MYKLKTVDVWDTLLRRNCHPECIKLATAAHVYFLLFGRFKAEYQSVWSIYQARVDTEMRLAHAARDLGKDEEYEIVDVLGHWLSLILAESHKLALPELIAEYELTVEMARTSSDPDIEAILADYPSEKTMFLSDFYMSAPMLQRLIEKNGLGHLLTDGISSCDVGLNKRSGALFKYVHETLAVQPHEHVHIGDNAWSDVESPAKFGILGISFVPEDTHTARLKYESLFSSRSDLFQHLRTLQNQALQARLGCDVDQSDNAFRIGVEAAPLFMGQALWVAEQVISHRLEKLFFLTREGEFFRRVYEQLFPTLELYGHSLPQHGDLEVSRLSTFVASMNDVVPQEFARIWRLNRSQKVSGLFSSLGLNSDEFFIELEGLGLQLNDVIENPETDSRLIRLIAAPLFQAEVRKRIQEQRELLTEYLSQNGIDGTNRVGVVDIGWRGTIQDNLAKVLPASHIHGMYLGLRKFINPQPVNVTKSAYAADESLDADTAQLFEVFGALEMLCNSDKGSAECYVKDGARVIAKRSISIEENSSYDQFSKHFQEGVIFATKIWAPYVERYVVSAGDMRELGLAVWRKLSTNPDADLAKIFIETPQHDIFGFGDIFQKNRVPSLFSVFLSPFLKAPRREVIHYIRRVQWTSAVKQLKDIGFIHRSVLVMLFTAANAYKRYRMKARNR